MRKKLFVLLLAALLLVPTAGCGKEELPPEPDPDPIEKPEPITEPEPDLEPEPYIPAGTNP